MRYVIAHKYNIYEDIFLAIQLFSKGSYYNDRLNYLLLVIEPVLFTHSILVAAFEIK
jgi:hypothetical protein